MPLRLHVGYEMTDKKTEALKLALEALIFAYYEDEDYNDDCQQKVNDARQAIREALAEQPTCKQQLQVEQTYCDDCGGVDHKCSLAHPTQQQEPVAYLDEGLGAFYWAKEYKKDVGFTPLYTSPQASKPWVGLTDEETIAQANKEVFSEAFARGAIWAELKLKKKNT